MVDEVGKAFDLRLGSCASTRNLTQPKSAPTNESGSPRLRTPATREHRQQRGPDARPAPRRWSSRRRATHDQLDGVAQAADGRRTVTDLQVNGYPVQQAHDLHGTNRAAPDQSTVRSPCSMADQNYDQPGRAPRSMDPVANSVCAPPSADQSADLLTSSAMGSTRSRRPTSAPATRLPQVR
jgi:hypothetical protein